MSSDPGAASPDPAAPAAAVPGPDASAPDAVTCCGCGTTGGAGPDDPAGVAAGVAMGWSSQTGARGREWLCGGCTRANLRSIEGRLDAAWW